MPAYGARQRTTVSASSATQSHALPYHAVDRPDVPDNECLRRTQTHGQSRKGTAANTLIRRWSSRMLALRWQAATLSAVAVMCLVTLPANTRMLRRQFRRYWERRYVYACQSYAYPPVPWCLWSNGIRPRHPRHSNVSLHYASARFGWPSERFRSHVEHARDAVEASGLIPPQNLHFYHDFPPFIRNDRRWEQHLQFCRNETSSGSLPFDPSRGGGFWFWKAPLLIHLLQTLNGAGQRNRSEGNPPDYGNHTDFVIYSDTDMVDHLVWISDLIDHMIERNHNLALYELEFLERHWVKPSVVRQVCTDAAVVEAALSTNQYNGAMLVVRKSALSFLQEWEDWCSRYDWINDARDDTLDHASYFKQHRHDQALLSLLIKCRRRPTERSIFYRPAMGNWKVHSMNV